MKADEIWKRSGLNGEYQAWQFGSDPDELADLVRKGIKTATCSSYELYLKTGEPVPKAGDCSIVLDSRDEAVCISEIQKSILRNLTRFPLNMPIRKARVTDHWNTGERSMLIF